MDLDALLADAVNAGAPDIPKTRGMDLDALLAEAVRARRLRHPPEARPAAARAPRRSDRAARGRAAARPRPTSTRCLRTLTAAAPERYERFQERATSTSPTRRPACRASASTSSASAARSRSRLRVIPREAPRFAELGLPAGVERLAEEHRGLVLVTGATGSGKTTTLAAMIDHINRTRQSHIVTIEDPIEVLHTGPPVDRQPARGRARHRELRPGAAPRAPPGSRTRS